jgi:hypothetical protein
MLQQLIRFAAATSCTTVPDSTGKPVKYCTNLPQAASSAANVQHIIQIILGIFAATAVLFIVIAGLNFVTAGGDSAKVAKARGTIVYALVGLVVAVSADVIVTVVIGKI